MRHVVFIAPFSAETTLRFLRALHALDNVHVTTVAHTLPPGADAALYQHVERVDNPMDEGHLHAAVQRLTQRFGRPHRIVGLLEPLQVAFAKLRESFGVTGTDVATAELFRDKGKMKDALGAAGLACARHRVLRSWQDATAFVDEVGFPLVLKPPAGMGCKATWRIRSVEQLRAALDAMRPSAHDPMLAEEMLIGQEHSLETITVAGEVRLSSITHYHPTPLEVVENPWIQWVVVAPRHVDGPDLVGAHELGRRAVKVLGLDSGMTHMEWFRRPDGRLAIGEIGARPPGAQIVELMSQVYDRDMHAAWARLMVDDDTSGPWERKWAAGVAFLRGPGAGRVASVEGLDAAQKKMGSLVRKAQLPQIGAPKKDGYEGDGWALVRHHDTEVVKQALLELITTVKVRYA